MPRSKDQATQFEIQMAQGLTLWEATALGLGATLGLGAFVLPILAGPVAGPATPLLFVLAGLLILPTALSYDVLSIAFPGSGGAYRLVRRVQGGGLAFLAGWFLLLTGLVASGVLARGFAEYLNALTDLWFYASAPTPITVVWLVVFLALANNIGSRVGRRWQGTLALLVSGGLVIFCLAYVSRPDLPLPSLGRALPPEAWSAMSIVFGAFLGLEVLALSSGEVQDLSHRVPRATRIYLIVGALFCALMAVLTVGPFFPSLDGLVMDTFARAPYLGLLLIALGLLSTLLALNAAFTWAAGLLYVMGRDGALPPVLAHTHRRFGTPRTALLLTAILVTILTLLVDWTMLAQLTSLGLVLVTATVNVTAWRFKRRETNGESPGAEPWFPLALVPPALGLLAGLVILPTFPLLALLLESLWLLGGIGVYAFYARHHEIVAKEGVTVFAGRSRKVIQEPSTYRILVPMVSSQANRSLVRQAARLARQRGGDVLALGVVSVPEQLPQEEGQRLAREKQVLMEWALAHGHETGVPIHAVTRIARDVAQGISDAAADEHCHLILLNWNDLSAMPGLSAVIQNAPCDVVAIQGPLGESIRSIMIPTHGGPNTPPAVRLGLSLLDPDDPSTGFAKHPGASAERAGQAGTVTVMCVAPNDSEVERRIALGYIEDGLADQEDRSRFVEKVVVSPSAVAGIVQEANHHDLIILGASEEGLFDRLLFGDLPEIVARRCNRPVIMVKRSRGLAVFWLRRLVQGFIDRLPRLTNEQRITIYHDIHQNASPSANYYVLISLSCVIATLGVVVNSPAVVIGAMLVAPLMSPILAFALSIVLGDARLLRSAMQAVLQGTLAAVGISMILGWLSPYDVVTPEMAARTQPTLLDLGIALASGAAGAYAVAREEVSAALPGVAIAAALMPPLSVVGLGLSIGRWDMAGGALLLFLTNLISITLAGALVFLGLGFRTGRLVFQFETRRGLTITLSLLVLISIPLALIMFDALQTSHTQQAVEGILREQINALPATQLDRVSYVKEGDRLVVSAWVDTSQSIDEPTVAAIRAALERDLGQPVTLRLFIVPIELKEAR